MVDNGDSVKGSVQDSLDDKKTLPTPFQETGNRQVSELAPHRQPRGIEAENLSATKKLAEVIAALLVLMFNLPGGSFAIVLSTARTVVQYMQIPPVDIERRDKMKRDVEEIQLNMKQICNDETKLEDKVNLHFQDTHSVILLNLDNDHLHLIHILFRVFSL